MTRPKLTLGQIVSLTSNYATDDVYSPKAVTTLTYVLDIDECLFVILQRLSRNEY